jgi:hypothetical protein
MKTHGGAPPFLTSALGGSEWAASCPSCFTSGERASDTHWIGGWVGPRASLNAVEQRKISCPCQELNPSCPAHSLLLHQKTYPGSQILNILQIIDNVQHAQQVQKCVITGRTSETFKWGFS